MDENPYAFQPGLLQAIRDGYASGHTRQVLSASTGAGKSVMMTEIVRLATEKGKRVLFMCERRNLAIQFAAHIERAGIDHGIMIDKTPRYRPDALVQIACVQSVEKCESIASYDIMLLDELHMMMRKSVMRLMDTRPNMRVLGATATPFHASIGEYFTNIISAPPMADLVTAGTLVPYRAYGAEPTNVDGLKLKSNGEWREEDLLDRGKMIVGNVATDYLRLSGEVFGRKSKAICFSSSIAHGAELVEAFSSHGINAIQLASGVEDEFKTDVFKEFSKPDSEIDILVSVDMLSRGFDQTDIEHVILARPIKKSFSTFVQMLGRGARKHGGKSLCVVQDHGHNWLRFSEPFAEYYYNGADSLFGTADKKPMKEPTENEKKESLCPKCGAHWPRNADMCVCGYIRQRRNEVEAVAGEMLELTGASEKNTKNKSYSTEYKQEFYSGLLYIQSQRTQYKPTWAFANYCERFGHEPKGHENIAKPPTQDVKNWDTHKRIAYARRRGRTGVKHV